MDYFYRNNADQYTFYRIPKALFQDVRFRHMSCEAKVLYGLMLDRVSLSTKNGWHDRLGRVFIYYTLVDIMADINCGDRKATRLLTELDQFGLVERIRQGLGRPSRIYVKNMMAESSNERFQTRQNDESGVAFLTDQDPSELRSNNTEKSNTEVSEINPIYPAENFLETDNRHSSTADDNDSINDPIIGVISKPITDSVELHTGNITPVNHCSIRKYCRDAMGFDSLRKKYPARAALLDEMLDIIADTLCARQESIRVAGDYKGADVVKGQFMKLKEDHIEYVLNCFISNTTKVRNIKQYLKSALYNAPMTIDSYYTAEANHDMYGDREDRDD